MIENFRRDVRSEIVQMVDEIAEKKFIKYDKVHKGFNKFIDQDELQLVLNKKVDLEYLNLVIEKKSNKFETI